MIDDDDDDSAAPTPSSNNRRPAAVATTSRQPATSTYGSSGHSNGTVRHADKKRKIQQPSQYDAGAYSQHQPSYSTTHTPHLNGNYSSPTTVSAQSSSSSLLGTTAETSLGLARTLPVSSANGTKRKRYTRSTAAAAADAFASYHPPPQPPIKAPDVIVQVVRDVSLHELFDVIRQPHLERTLLI